MLGRLFQKLFYFCYREQLGLFMVGERGLSRWADPDYKCQCGNVFVFMEPR